MARRAAAGGAAAGAGLFVLGGVARDQGVRAHQHHRGVRLCRANSRVLSATARPSHARPRAAAALFDGLERRHPRGGRSHGHAGDGGGVGAGRRRGGGRALLSFDMAGNTAKASLIRGGNYEPTPDYEVGGGSSMSRWMNGTGHPIGVPVIDLAEVSAGGGSIAWVDRAGGLRVGPKSAGADPGPVCYGRGGSEPTVTDCNLLLGYLDKASLLSG